MITDLRARALLVIALEKIATLLTKAAVRLYARGLLSGFEIRFLLDFCSALHRTSIRLLRPANK